MNAKRREAADSAPPNEDSIVDGRIPDEDDEIEMFEVGDLDDPKHGQKLITLDELGMSLPTYVGPDRGFAFRARNLGSQRDTAARTPNDVRDLPADNVAWELALNLTYLGGQKVDDRDPKTTVGEIMRMPWPSVVYMWLWWLKSRSKDGTYRQENMRCPHAQCRHVQDAKFKIGTMPVRDYGVLDAMPNRTEDLGDDVELFFPPEKRVSQITLQPAPWQALCGLSYAEIGVEEDVVARFLARAVVKTDTVPGRAAVPESLINGLDEETWVYLNETQVLLSGGPVMGLEGVCRRCKGKMVVTVQWANRDFFGGSSKQRRAQRRSRRKLRSSGAS